MTENVPLHEAGGHLDELADRAIAGEEVILTRDGKPAVRLVPAAGAGEKRGRKRRLGLAEGKFWMAEDFDQTPDWLIDAFHGIDAGKPIPEEVSRDLETLKRRKSP